MITYEKYKDSGIEWLGQIPEHWNKTRLKDFGNLQNGVSRGKEYFGTGHPFVSYSNVYNNCVSIEHIKTLANSSPYEQKLYSVKENDILFTRTSETVDEIGFAATVLKTINKAAFSGFVIRFRPKKTLIIKEFSKYLFRANIYRNYLSKEIALVTRASLNQNILGCLTVIIPPLSEQKAIAQYLDDKTQANDKKVTLLKQKISYYKELRKSIINKAVTKGLTPGVEMKDSNIDWIGQIPKHWEVKRFKDSIKKYTTGGTPSTGKIDYFDGDNIWVCISDLNDNNFIDNSKIKLTDEAIANANIVKTSKGSLLYSFKLSIGKIAFANCDLYTNEAILSIFPNKNIDLKYYYFMLPIFMDLAATENIYGAKMLNQKLIANALLLHPPKAEQTAIANYLDEKTAQIDSIISNIEQQINTLKELRKTLINDVVTGKIKVA